MHLYYYHREKEIKTFWSKLLNIPENQFEKTYRKYRSKEKTFRRNFGGICFIKYYDVYLKSRKIAHAREHLSDLDTVVVQKIQNGEIPKAANIRDKLSKICGLKGKDKGKILKNFVNNSWSLDECHERAISGGMNNAFYQRLNKFRTQICDPDTKSLIKKMTKSHRDKCVYELKHIRKRVADLLKMLEEKQ